MTQQGANYLVDASIRVCIDGNCADEISILKETEVGPCDDQVELEVRVSPRLGIGCKLSTFFSHCYKKILASNHTTPNLLWITKNPRERITVKEEKA